MRQLHAGPQRHLPEVQHLRRHQRLQLSSGGCGRTGRAGPDYQGRQKREGGGPTGPLPLFARRRQRYGWPMPPASLPIPPVEAVATAATASPRPSTWRRVPATMAFVAGFVDVQCFLGLAQTFAAFMTGTLIALGSELADPTPGVGLKAAMIAIFVPSVALASLALRALRRRVDDEAVVRRLLLAEAGLLAVMALAGGLLQPEVMVGSWQMIVVGMAAVAAMSVQNVLMVHLLAFHPATTVMTLNMVHLIGHALGAAPPPAHQGQPPSTNASEVRRYAFAVAPFIVGVAGGGFCYRWLGFWSIAVPVAALLLLSAWLARQGSGDDATAGR
ncbi:MAG: YoaK family protein [Amaricoccus sp.]